MVCSCEGSCGQHSCSCSKQSSVSTVKQRLLVATRQEKQGDQGSKITDFLFYRP